MIGLFDSGIGGLTVVKEVMKKLPDYSLVYFGDTARTPYGNKSAEVVREYGLQAAQFLVEHGAKIMVVACNTVSSVGLEAIKQAYPNVPMFDVISPAVEAINSRNEELGTHDRCIGIMGTRALVNSGIYQKALSNNFKVVAQAAPLLVPLVEEGWLNKPETKRIIKTYLTPFKQAQANTLVLACTHYPLLKKIIAPRLSKRTKIVDPAEETARVLADWLKARPEVDSALPRGESHFYVSDLTPQFQAIAEKWLKRTIKLEKVSLA